MKKVLAIALSSLVLIAACAPSGPGVRPDRIDDPERRQIQQLLAEDNHRAAALAFIELAQSRPDQADSLMLDAAEAWLAGEYAEQASETLERIDTDELDFFDQVRFDLAQAELSLLTGDLAGAGWLLAHSAERLPEALEERHRMLEERLQALEARPVRAAFEALETAVEEDDFDPELALALFIEFPLAEIEGLLYEAGDRPELLPWLDLVISAREFLLDDPAMEKSLAKWESRYPDIGYSADQAGEWIAAWRKTVSLPESISVVLPGPESPLHRPGAALRDGLIGAWLELAPDRRPGLHFTYLEDENDAVVAAWFDIRERDSEFVIGPLDRDHVNTLLELPDSGLLPTLLLNLPDKNEALTDGLALSALALPPEEEAEMAAIRALVKDHERALVLGPYTSWGERVSQAFVNAFTLGGGQVLAQRIYDPDDADHSYVLTDALEIDRSEERINRLDNLLDEDVESVPQRRTDLDLIFLASRADDGRQLRPQLRFFDAGDVPLMATSHIIAGAPRPERDRDLDGVILPMAPWFLDHTPAGQKRRQAERLHPDLDNPTLSRLHALGRDAMKLVPWLEMMRADPELYLPGMTGRLTLSDNNAVERDLPFVRILDGVARPEP